MSARKDTDTKIPVDVNTDSGFISGPIDSLDSGDLGVPLDRINAVVRSEPRNENTDSGLCSESFSNLKLDDCETNIPSRSSRSRGKQSKTKELPSLQVLLQQDDDGDTPLHLSAVHGSEKSVGILIRLCPDKSYLDLTNDYRHTALHLAVMSGYSVVTRMLVLAGASLSVRDVAGRTPVHIAAETGHELCLKALLSPVEEKPHRNLTAVLNQKDYNGQTCVHIAAKAGSIKTLQTLMYYGADINAKEGLAGWTALHVAASRGDERLCQWLLKASGVSRAARDFGGRTPRRLARRTKAAKAFQGLPDASDSETESDDDYDSEGETLFERLLTNPNPINVA